VGGIGSGGNGRGKGGVCVLGRGAESGVRGGVRCGRRGSGERGREEMELKGEGEGRWVKRAGGGVRRKMKGRSEGTLGQRSVKVEEGKG